MNNLPSIFLSYNPNSDFEETLAIRLHTIGAVHGFQMYRPERNLNSNSISIETMARINQSDYYILFSTNKLSPTALAEIRYAFERFHDKKRIIIIYDALIGKNMTHTDFCTELSFDRRKESPEEFIQKVLSTIKSNKPKGITKNANQDALPGLLIAGLALLILGVVLSKK